MLHINRDLTILNLNDSGFVFVICEDALPQSRGIRTHHRANVFTRGLCHEDLRRPYERDQHLQDLSRRKRRYNGGHRRRKLRSKAQVVATHLATANTAATATT